MLDDLHHPAQRLFDPLDEAALLVRDSRPRSTGAEEGSPGAARGALCRRDDPECWPRAPAHPRSTRWYRRADAACALSRACRRRSRAAPFLARFDRLTVDDGRAGGGLTSLLHPHLFAQRCVDALPRPIVAPGAEVAPHRRKGAETHAVRRAIGSPCDPDRGWH